MSTRPIASTATGQDEAARCAQLHLYFDKFGPLMQGRDLWKALGYPSQGAFNQARRRGTLPVRLLHVPGRRGVHAYTHEVARWVDRVGSP